MRKWEGFNNLMGGIQALIVAISIVVAGAWTWRTFDLTLQKENAEATVVQLNESLKKEAKLIIQITANSKVYPGKNESRYIEGTIFIKNNGNDLANIILENGPLMVTDVSFNENGEKIIGKTIRSGILGDVTFKQPYLTSYHIHGGNEKVFPFLVKVPRSSIYYVDFRVNQPNEKLRWSGSSYVFVE